MVNVIEFEKSSSLWHTRSNNAVHKNSHQPDVRKIIMAR